MKTAMQELKYVIGEMIKNGGTEEDLFAVIAHIDNWGLEKEKEQLLKEYHRGMVDEFNIILNVAKPKPLTKTNNL